MSQPHGKRANVLQFPAGRTRTIIWQDCPKCGRRARSADVHTYRCRVCGTIWGPVEYVK
jgi:hypothetical protein